MNSSSAITLTVSLPYLASSIGFLVQHLFAAHPWLTALFSLLLAVVVLKKIVRSLILLTEYAGVFVAQLITWKQRLDITIPKVKDVAFRPPSKQNSHKDKVESKPSSSRDKRKSTSCQPDHCAEKLRGPPELL